MKKKTTKQLSDEVEKIGSEMEDAFSEAYALERKWKSAVKAWRKSIKKEA